MIKSFQHEPYVEKPGKRLWHFNSKGLDCTLKDGRTFKLIAANASDKQWVAELYLRSPVPGYSLGSVQVIINPVLRTRFSSHVQLLSSRSDDPFFTPNWHLDDQADWRYAVYNLFRKMRKKGDDAAPHVNFLPLWHGTQTNKVESICKTGFASLAMTDTGFFGNGIYSTNAAEYAWRVYSKGGPLLINWVACYSAYPFIAGDNVENGSERRKYDGYFIPVAPRNPNNPNEVNYDACKPDQKYTYVEMMVSDPASCHPTFVVELQKDTLTSLEDKTFQPEAIFLKGMGYYKVKNYDVAKYYFLEAARYEHANSLYMLGYMFFNGDGMQVDEEKALSYFRKAKQKNCPEATAALEKLNEKIRNTFATGMALYEAQRFRDAVKIFKTIHYVLDASYMLGKCYSELEDFHKAVLYFVEAIDAKHQIVDAHYRLGKCYYCLTNYSQAIKHLTVAAKENHPQAIHVLGICCYYGYGIERPDKKKAIDYFKFAAKLGCQASLEMLEKLQITL